MLLPYAELEEAPFCCDKCGTPHVVNPTLKERRPRGPNHRPAYGRKRFDPETQQLLTLCNACALAMDRRAKGVQPPKSKVSVLSSLETESVLFYLVKFCHQFSTVIFDAMPIELHGLILPHIWLAYLF